MPDCTSTNGESKSYSIGPPVAAAVVGVDDTKESQWQVERNEKKQRHLARTVCRFDTFTPMAINRNTREVNMLKA